MFLKNRTPGRGTGVFFLVVGGLSLALQLFLPGIVCMMVGLFYVLHQPNKAAEGEDKTTKPMSRKERREAYRKLVSELDKEFSIPYEGGIDDDADDGRKEE